MLTVTKLPKEANDSTGEESATLELPVVRDDLPTGQLHAVLGGNRARFVASPQIEVRYVTVNDHRRPPRRKRQHAPRALQVSVVVLLAFFLAGLAGLVELHHRPALFSSLRHFATFSTNRGATRVSSPDGARAATAASTAAFAPAGTRASSPAAPLIHEIAPGTGSAGTRLVISGTRLMSANGVVVVSVGEKAVSTSCPSASRCVAAVPAGAGKAVPVRVHTASGWSNVIYFHYQRARA